MHNGKDEYLIFERRLYNPERKGFNEEPSDAASNARHVIGLRSICRQLESIASTNPEPESSALFLVMGGSGAKLLQRLWAKNHERFDSSEWTE